jgi:hypothetical protein
MRRDYATDPRRAADQHGVCTARTPVPTRSAKPDKPASAAGSAFSSTDVHVVKRRCTICDWDAQLIEEGPQDDRLCPWCYGQTERTAIIGLVVPIPLPPGQKNPHAASLGRLGGIKGGRARAARLNARQRHDIAAKAARARWGKK